MTDRLLLSDLSNKSIAEDRNAGLCEPTPPWRLRRDRIRFLRRDQNLRGAASD